MVIKEIGKKKDKKRVNYRPTTAATVFYHNIPFLLFVDAGTILIVITALVFILVTVIAAIIKIVCL